MYHVALSPSRIIISTIEQICEKVVNLDYDDQRGLNKWRLFLNDHCKMFGTEENLVGRVKANIALASMSSDFLALGYETQDVNNSTDDDVMPYVSVDEWEELERKITAIRALLLRKDSLLYPAILPGLIDRMHQVESIIPPWKEDDGVTEELVSSDAFNKDFDHILSLLRFQYTLSVRYNPDQDDEEKMLACREYIIGNQNDAEFRMYIALAFNFNKGIGFSKEVYESELEMHDSMLR